MNILSIAYGINFLFDKWSSWNVSKDVLESYSSLRSSVREWDPINMAKDLYQIYSQRKRETSIESSNNSSVGQMLPPLPSSLAARRRKRKRKGKNLGEPMRMSLR